ncbi:MAG TPA: phosphoenolpyruvate carboxykinase (ATP) [Chloroflexota bacterium]|nr:phosphoenolpyruvate carboxykinase (ATP) [Chloroflexota bacterium]
MKLEWTRQEREAAPEATWLRAQHNLSVPTLIEHALAQGNAQLATNGALCSDTTPRTGRSPRDKFIVRDDETADRVAWGPDAQPIDPEVAARLAERVAAYLDQRHAYVVDAWAGADPAHRLGVRVVAEYAWHALFARQLFIRLGPDEGRDFAPGFTVLAAPDFRCDPARDGTRSEVAVILDFARRLVTIAGTRYAGEIKKSVFSYLNYVLPAEGVFPMHCGANVGPAGDVALFFGLSGTGKTTLSADPERSLIGDDEHGWGDNGVFNFEGGCYAKCINLHAESEPQIHAAIRFGAVLENVVLDPVTREPDYDDDSLTENTRAAYPVDFIPGVTRDGLGGHAKTVLLLTADAFGVLPPLARLTNEQAMYYFLSGYTAKLAGTEAGMAAEPEATFSTCFASPFLALPPMLFADMLHARLSLHGARCYLINTGWSGGPFGVGSRISLPYTRAIVRAAISGALDTAPVWTDPVFGLQVPEAIPGVPAGVLRPRDTWGDPAAYDQAATSLAERFRANFSLFPLAPASLAAAGPRG